MRIDIVAASRLDPAELDRWRAAHLASPGMARHPMLSPDFILAVPEDPARLRVAIMDDGAARGWFAFVAGGSDGPTLSHGLASVRSITHEPGFRCDAETLLRACGWHAWRYTRYPSVPFPCPAGPRAGDVAVGSLPNPVIDLSGGYEAYLADLRRRSRSTLPRVLRHDRRLHREHEVRFTYEAKDPEYVRLLLARKEEQVRRMGHPVRLPPTDDVVERVTRLATLDAPTCRGDLAVMHVDDRPIAILFTVRDDTTMTAINSVYEADHAKYSPGLVLLLRMLERAAGLGIRLYDMGPGDQAYKITMATGREDLVEGVMFRRSVPGAALLAKHGGDLGLRRVITGNPRARAAAQAGLRALAKARRA